MHQKRDVRALVTAYLSGKTSNLLATIDYFVIKVISNDFCYQSIGSSSFCGQCVVQIKHLVDLLRKKSIKKTLKVCVKQLLQHSR